jgi:hypothetical protein
MPAGFGGRLLIRKDPHPHRERDLAAQPTLLHRLSHSVGLCHPQVKLALMRRILLGAVAAVLLLAAGTRAADALGVGGIRLRCGCVETCWCKRPSLTVFRWVTPGRWHHIGLTAEEKQFRRSEA